ncbi:hypothetical protein [Lacibacter sp. H407]|uniref:hypothetical protein n=1 Tax=Lacibacter sp. H407 TaxID=3133423 RepID=UPI0030BFE386
MNFIRRVFIFLVICFGLMRCTILSEFYIVNMKAEPVKLFLKFNGAVKELTSSVDILPFASGQTALELSDTLTYQIIDDSTLSVVIPANTTTLVGQFLTPNSFNGIFILTDGSSQNLSTEQIKNHVKVTKRLFNPYHYTFQID